MAKRGEKRSNPGILRPDDVLPVVHADRQLVVVDKPAGLDTGRLPDGDLDGLVEILRSILGETELRAVNRLARYESGLVVLARDAETGEALRAAWKKGQVRQEYLAVLLGRLGRGTLRVATQHGSSRGRVRGRPPGAGSTRSVASAMVTARRGTTDEGGTNTTIQSLVVGEKRTLASCRTTSPTTHALRAQLRSAGHRLLGDDLHRPERAGRDAPATCLHLSRIVLPGGNGNPARTFQRAAPDFSPALRGERDAFRPLRAALARRLPLLQSSDTDAFRLLTGGCEDVPGINLDRFGRAGVVQIDAEKGPSRQRIAELARWYGESLKLEAVYGRISSGGTTEPAEGRRSDAALLLYGRDLEGETIVREFGLRFIVRPEFGFSVGLFPDQRENRRKTRHLSEGRSVLNLFAYTCGFSVAAAAGGATSVTSVDLSPKALEWGRRNFEVNGLCAEGHVLERGSASDYLRRAAKQGRTYDLVMIDAPTFAHGRNRKQSFSIARDLSGLVEQAETILAPNGILFVSVNYRRMSWRGLRERVKSGLGGRRYRELPAPPLPIDYGVDPDHAKWVWFEVG